MSWRERLRRIGCPPGWKLTRAVSGEIEPRLEWHVARCRRCATEYQSLQMLVVKAKTTFPAPERLPRERNEAIGERLRAFVSSRPLSAAAGRRLLRRPFLGAVPVAAVVVALVVWGAKHSFVSRGSVVAPATSVSRASIRAIGRARFDRVRFQPDEIVRVEDGEIELEIAPLHADERFRVVTEDGEVEVRGTSFKVSVSDQSLAAVHVWRGRVEVRARNGVFAVLEAGDDWVRSAGAPPPGDPGVAGPSVPSATAAPRTVTTTGAAPATKSAPTGRVIPPAGAVPPRRSTTHHDKSKSSNRSAGVAVAASGTEPGLDPARGGALFGHAWSLLRGGDPKAAADEFAETERLARGQDIEEDALYWRAVATARAGDSGGARALFNAFLERFPRSSRAAEAAAAVGWLLLDGGETRAARRAFERAALDPSPAVRASAQEGLRRTADQD